MGRIIRSIDYKQKGALRAPFRLVGMNFSTYHFFCNLLYYSWAADYSNGLFLPLIGV